MKEREKIIINPHESYFDILLKFAKAGYTLEEVHDEIRKLDIEFRKKLSEETNAEKESKD